MTGNEIALAVTITPLWFFAMWQAKVEIDQAWQRWFDETAD